MRIRQGALVILAAVAIGSWLPTFRSSSAAEGKVGKRDSEVSAERIARHVEFLASDKLQGRRAGTSAADQAADYIARQFRDSNLKPAATAGFLQTFTFVASVKLGADNSFQMKATDVSRAFKVTEDFMPLAFSSSARATGQVIFAGFGIGAPELQYDNYSGVDVAGKIVMVMRGSPEGDNPHGRFSDYTTPGLEIQKKTLKAREKGASGIVFISDEERFSEDRLSRLHHDLNFLDAGIPALAVTQQVAQAILSAGGSTLAELQNRAKESAAPSTVRNVEIEFKTDVVKVEGKAENVVGILQGSDPELSSEFIVIGAHYDHLGLGGSESLAAKPEGQIHHGADDNASGTSVLIELARVMSANRPKFKRSIVFIAFSGEELGLLGSAAYTRNPAVPLKSTVAMLNMDMVGRLRNGSLFVGGVGTSPAWQPLLDRLNGSGAAAPSGGSSSGSRFQLGIGQDGFGPSDHQSFYVKDLPVLFFFTGSHDDYHKPSDTADKINSEGASQIGEFVRKITVEIANEPQRIAFTRVKTESKPTGRGFAVYLGTVPNYSDQSDGLKLDGIRAGSPAERAGLQAGDVVTKLGSVPVKNVYDYTYALGELKAGEEIEVVLRRDGREVRLKITPEKRK
ncbi:MAG TPA: M28 family peptidase [Blastocatellia bacterium]|nr:M28 family peptidase [Blastocatellia bacterium]